MKDWSEEAIPVKWLKVNEAKTYTRLWATFQLAMPFVSDVRLARCVSIALDVCPHCCENPKGRCNCWRDE